MMNRRSFLETTTLAAMTAAALPLERAFAQASTTGATMKTKKTTAKKQEFWPNGAQLAISFSMQFEAGVRIQGRHQW